MSQTNFHSSGITYVGVRTKHIDVMKQFAETVLGYEKTYDDGKFVALTTPQGQRFELHAEDTPDKQFYPLEGAVTGFEIEDFEGAVAWLKANNYEIFPEGMGGDLGGTRWAHFRGPDGNIYEFVHHPSVLAGDKPE
jgi:catechol 2,3-dioxygenase-like lactoylglutathione lyase family enzyme